MDFQHGISATLTIQTVATGLVTLTGTIESATHDLQRELAEIRAWGELSVIRVQGLRNCVFTANGAWDETIDGHLFAAWNADDDPVAVTFAPDGVQTYVFDAFIASYGQTHGSGDKSTFSINLSSTGLVTRP